MTTRKRDPYIHFPAEVRDFVSLNDYLENELRRVEYALNGFEETAQIDLLESTANASASSYQLLDCSATAIVISLPSAARVKGKKYTLKKIDSSANKGAIRAAGSETIDGVTSASLTAQYQVKSIVSDGSNWYVV